MADGSIFDGCPINAAISERVYGSRGNGFWVAPIIYPKKQLPVIRLLDVRQGRLILDVVQYETGLLSAVLRVDGNGGFVGLSVFVAGDKRERHNESNDQSR